MITYSCFKVNLLPFLLLGRLEGGTKGGDNPLCFYFLSIFPFSVILISSTIIGSFYLCGVGLQLVNLNQRQTINLLNISVISVTGSVVLFTWYKVFEHLK